MMKHILLEGGYRWCFYHRDSLHRADRNRFATLAKEALQGGGAFSRVHYRILFEVANKYGCYYLWFT